MRWMQKLAESALKTVCPPSLKNSVAYALSRQPCEVGQPNGGDIEDSGSGPRALQNPVVFAAVKDWLQVVAPHLILTGYLEATKTILSSGHPMVALACKRYTR